MNIWISLNSFDKIKRFLDVTTHLEYDLDLISGRYIVDGKSILGIFSLDLNNPIEVQIVQDENYYPIELAEFIIPACEEKE